MQSSDFILSLGSKLGTYPFATLLSLLRHYDIDRKFVTWLKKEDGGGEVGKLKIHKRVGTGCLSTSRRRDFLVFELDSQKPLP